MSEKYDCITFHTSACDDHLDRMLNVHGPEGLDDVCPLCELDRLTAEVERLKQALTGIIDKSRSWPILPPEGDGVDIYAAHIISLRNMAEKALRSET